MDKMAELLLTVLALSQEGYKGPLAHAIPERLAYTMRKARKLGYVHVDDDGAYLEDEGAVVLEKGFGSRPFGEAKRTE